MGRKSTVKSKEKRLQRKEEQQRLGLAMTLVNSANKLEDPLEPFVAFRKFERNGSAAELLVKRVTEMDKNLKIWAFELTKKNMEAKYNDCSWGWNDKKKYAELTDESAWFLLARNLEGDYLGFSHFRFDIDEGIEVLYCYELQLEPSIQRKGLGKFMMQILELMAFKNQMKKVILTVLKNNPNSMFFKALNYQLDDSCPIDDEDSYCYEILSKFNKKLCVSHTNNSSLLSMSAPIHKHFKGHCCSGHCC